MHNVRKVGWLRGLIQETFAMSLRRYTHRTENDTGSQLLIHDISGDIGRRDPQSLKNSTLAVYFSHKGMSSELNRDQETTQTHNRDVTGILFQPATTDRIVAFVLLKLFPLTAGSKP